MTRLGKTLLIICCLYSPLECFIINARGPNPCKGLEFDVVTMFGSKSEKGMLVDAEEHVSIFTKNVFRGNNVALRCRQAKAGWFWSKTSPFLNSTMTKGLSPVTNYGQCLQHSFFESAQVLQVNAQDETEGFFICTERNYRKQHRVWARHAIFQLHIYRHAIEVNILSFHAYYPEGCRQAKKIFDVKKTALLGESISYDWESVNCEMESVWHCPIVIGYSPPLASEWKVIDTLPKDLKIRDDPVFFYTGPILEQARIRLVNVRLAWKHSITLGFVAHDLNQTDYVKRLDHVKLGDLTKLGQFVLNKDGLCEEVWKDAGKRGGSHVSFEWILVDPAMQLIEFPNGFRVGAKDLPPQALFSDIVGITLTGVSDEVVSYTFLI